MSGAPATVLVVDDSPENRYAIRRYLSGGEFDVWEAETGSEGLEMAARDPDLIVLDVHLPDISGFEVCRSLKEDERTRHIPVLQRSSSFRRRHTSKPLMSGRWTSSRIRSGSRAAISSPSEPVSASKTLNSGAARYRRIA